MNKVEKIKAEIERRIKLIQSIGRIESYAVNEELKDILSFIDYLEEPVSEDLEKAAWQYYDRNKPLMPSELDLHKELIDFFKAGVRWKEQNDSNLSEVLYRDNLDEMAEEYSSCTYLEEVLGEGDIEVLKARLKNTFKAGAKWQKEQTVKWLKENKDHPFIKCEDPCLSGHLTDEFIEDFKKQWRNKL